MMYLMRRGKGARRRVVHVALFDPMTGEPTMQPLCGRPNGIEFNMTSNVPWGQPRCKWCLRASGSYPQASTEAKGNP